MGKEMIVVDWSHFTLADFLELRWRLLNDWQAVLPGGEYFGQVRIGDVSFNQPKGMLYPSENPFA